MADDRLVMYVRKHLEQGYTRAEIRATLLRTGKGRGTIRRALAAVRDEDLDPTTSQRGPPQRGMGHRQLTGAAFASLVVVLGVVVFAVGDGCFKDIVAVGAWCENGLICPPLRCGTAEADCPADMTCWSNRNGDQLCLAATEAARRGDAMRGPVIEPLASDPTGRRLALTLPSVVVLNRSVYNRTFAATIRNKDGQEHCFCLYPHLVVLDGPGSRTVVIVKDFLGLDLDEQERMRIQAYIPRECYAEKVYACAPNTWFSGVHAVTVGNGQMATLTQVLATPTDPRRAPRGRYGFSVELCTYDGPGPCDRCEPEQCFPTTKAPGYQWRDAQQFFVQVGEG